MTSGFLICGCFFMILLSQDLVTRRDSNNIVIWTINPNDCGQSKNPLQDGDCDCDDTIENSKYDTPCCGINPEQCASNGAISDIDGVTFINSLNGNTGTPNETQVKPPDGDECKELSPPYIFGGDPGICTDFPRYKAIRDPNNATLSHSDAQILCEAYGTTLGTINPYDSNFDSNILVSYIKQYRDILKTCLLGNDQDNEFTFDPCWIGAFAVMGNQRCDMWQLRKTIYSILYILATVILKSE